MTPEAFSEIQFSEAYPEGVELNYWQIARNSAIARVLSETTRADRPVLEIGAGRGLVVVGLIKKGFRVYGCEISKLTVPDELKNVLFTGMDMTQLDLSLREQVETVLLLDVLEHIQNVPEFLRCVGQSFSGLRQIILTVPARAEIRSNYDDHYGHYRRYDLDLISSESQAAGFDIARWQYLFHSLYWAARVWIGKGRKRAIRPSVPKSYVSVLAHQAIARVLSAESRILPGRWPGSSILAVLTPHRTSI